MPTPAKSNPDVADLEEQLKALRTDVATLADLLKGAAQHKVAETGKAIHDQTDDLVRRGKEVAEGATLRARGAVTSIEEQIAEKPVQSALIALLVGLVIGSMGRR